MEYAICKIKSLNKWKRVEISEIKSGALSIKEISEIVCPYCNEQGWLKQCYLKESHFAFAHKPDCPVVADGSVKHKSYLVITGEIVHEEDILTKNVFRKKRISKESSNGSIEHDVLELSNYSSVVNTCGADEELSEIDYSIQEELKNKQHLIDEIDMVKKYQEKNIYRPMGIYRLIQKNGIFEPILPDGRCGDDILLDSVHLLDVRKKGIEDGTKKLAIVKRAVPSNLKHPFSKPYDYLLFKDIYADDPENHILFLVKITHVELNNVFKTEIYGDKDNKEETRDPHKDLLIYAKWRRYPNDFYQIYISEIGNCAYSFVNMAYDNKNKAK